MALSSINYSKGISIVNYNGISEKQQVLGAGIAARDDEILF
jgi:hypothetical protein